MNSLAEFIKTVGTSLVERLIIAALAAVLTTYILTQRNDARISAVERSEVDLKIRTDKLETDTRLAHESQLAKCSLIEQRLERIATLVEMHMDGRK